jgi:hypothetical protein
VLDTTIYSNRGENANRYTTDALPYMKNGRFMVSVFLLHFPMSIGVVEILELNEQSS